jgi:SsrA-binding protein
MAKKKKKQPDAPAKKATNTVRIRNRRAWRDYHVEEKVECGLELQGTEVKSIRDGKVKLDEAHARVKNGEVYLVGAEIAMYPKAAAGMQHNPTRSRRLLVHKRQIRQLELHVQQKGRTLVPLELYFKRGWAKVSLGLVIGKQAHDKRETIKRRDAERDIAREMNRRR